MSGSGRRLAPARPNTKAQVGGGRREAGGRRPEGGGGRVGMSRTWWPNAASKPDELSVDEELLVSSVRSVTLLPHDVLDTILERCVRQSRVSNRA